MLTQARRNLVNGLRRRKIRESEGLFLAEGIRVVEDLLDAGLDLRFAVVASTLEDTPRGAALLRRLELAAPVHPLREHEFAELAATENPQGVLAVARTPEHTLAAQETGDRAVILALDGVQDPGNFGTLARTAEALGVPLLVALPGTVDAWNPKAVRAAAGATFRLPVVRPETAELLAWIRARGGALCGADREGEAADGLALPGLVALFVGNEGAGLGDEVRAVLDHLVAVPQRGRGDSLNVAAAAAILLFQLTRTR
jgi:RNA methyltransferase, TrmH family